MAVAMIWLLSVLLLGTTRASPLPEGKNLIISNPDPAIFFNHIMRNAPAQVAANNQPKIYDLQVHSEIKFRFAQTLVTSKVRNPGNFTQQLSFSVVLPQEAFITGFVMETSDKTYRAFLTEKSEAEKEYGTAVDTNTAGAMVSYRNANLFDININIEGHQKVTFKLAYEQLLTREGGLYRHVITIAPGQVVKGMKVKVHILEPRKITKLLVPTHANNHIGNRACAGATVNATCESGLEMATKRFLSPQEVLLEFTPTAQEQERLAQETGKGMNGQVELLYDVERHESGGEILVKDGYFVHFFALPPGTTYLPKHITFVLDVSGSMAGKKIEQLKDAMQEILSDLEKKQDDLFNIIPFSSDFITWGFGGTTDAGQTVTQVAFPATQKNIQEAKQRIIGMGAHGGTNIFDALKGAVQTAQKEQIDHPKVTKPIIFFLTDGEANEGAFKNPDDIIRELDKINVSPKIPIYSFSFGEDGHIDFLKQLSLANSGVARLIYPGADANVQLKGAYQEISNAVLSDVTFKYLPEEVDLSSVTKLDYNTFFEGTELVVTGRTIDKNAKKITAEVTASGKNNSEKKFQVQSVGQPAPKYKMDDSLITLADPNAPPNAGSMERAWAYLTIKQLIDKSKTVSPGCADPEKERAIELAKKYSFGSEVTSFVVIKPGGNPEVANFKRIIPTENGSTTTPSPITPATEAPVTPDPSVESPKKPNENKRKPVLKFYTKLGGLDYIKWLPQDVRKQGYLEMLDRSGNFSTYTILEDVQQPHPEDEPDCEIDGIQGKCRHLSLCVMREVAQDYFKYMKYYQCELEDYLAVCCPHE